MSNPKQKPLDTQFKKQEREKEYLAARTAASMKKWLKKSSDTVAPLQETESKSQKIIEGSSGPSC